MQHSGTVVFWRDDKGFGFVVSDQTADKIFFHIRDNSNRNIRPQSGDQLEFGLQQDKQGRTIAAPWSVRHSNQPNNPTVPLKLEGAAEIARAQHISLLFRLSFLAAVVLALLFGQLIYVLPLLYFEASLFTYWLYKADKEAAIARHGNRLTEETLQLFALIGGWPGAYLAQQQLAHKRSKLSFRREFGFVILGNTMLVVWLFSPWGQAFLARVALWTSQ